MFTLDTEKKKFEPIPNGDYVCEITGTEIRKTKLGTGKYIRTEFTIISKEQNGRKIWTNFNIENPNDKAVEVGLKMLKKLILSSNYSGKTSFNSAEEASTVLTGLSVGVRTKIKSSEQYGEQVEVDTFMKPSKTEDDFGF